VLFECLPGCLWTCSRRLAPRVRYVRAACSVLEMGRETALLPVVSVTITNAIGAQAGVMVLFYTLELFAKIRLDIIEEHPIFCFEPAAEPLDPYCMPPAKPPQSAGV
jgi:hypothetical protein